MHRTAPLKAAMASVRGRRTLSHDPDGRAVDFLACGLRVSTLRPSAGGRRGRGPTACRAQQAVILEGWEVVRHGYGGPARAALLHQEDTRTLSGRKVSSEFGVVYRAPQRPEMRGLKASSQAVNAWRVIALGYKVVPLQHFDMTPVCSTLLDTPRNRCSRVPYLTSGGTSPSGNTSSPSSSSASCASMPLFFRKFSKPYKNSPSGL